MVLIEKEITDKILMVGVDASANAKGGMASVVKSYLKYFETLNYTYSWKDTKQLYKILIFIRAIIAYIIKLVINSNIKLVHVHTTVDSSFRRKSIFIKIAKLFRKKILLHMHGGAFPEYYENQTIRKKRKILNIITCVDKIAVIVEEPWLKWFNEIGVPIDKIIVINNTIEFPQINRNTHLVPEVRMIYMGKLIKEKGIFDILDVLKCHKDELVGKVQFKIAGFHDESIILDIIEDNCLHEFVSFEGFLSGIEKIKLLNWGNVLLQPSYFEAQSISILEGMSYGLAILASRVGGIPSIVKHNVNGLLFEPGDKEGIWNAIKYIIDNPDIISIYGYNGSLEVLQYFPKETIGKLRKEYIELIYE